MGKVAESLSDAFLSKLIGKKVKVYLSNSIALTGTLKDYDSDSLVISGRDGNDTDSLVERLQVSTIQSDEVTDAKPTVRRR